MRILVLGGTRFIGPPTVQLLVDAGHEVTLFHHGRSEPRAAAGAEHVHGDFAAFAESVPMLRELSPDVVVDTVPYIRKSGHGVLHFAGIADRAVVVTSLDVYRAFAVAWGSEGDGVAEPMPVTEESPLRAASSPDLTADIDFDNLDVERALVDQAELAVTVLRLPMVYGQNDERHRLFNYVRRMDDRREAIILDESRASLRWSRGYVDNVAAAVALAASDPRSRGRIYNVAALKTPTETEWVRSIGKACGWTGDVVVAPTESLPPAMRSPLAVRQDLIVSSERIRGELDYVEQVSLEEGLRRTVDWTRANPPSDEPVDYSGEDRVLAALTV
jgi:nucleoside-diphosphate-sugar epimerase